MLSFFGVVSEVKPQLIIQSSKICFSLKIKDAMFFQTWKYIRQLSFWIVLNIQYPSVWIEFAFKSWKKAFRFINQLFRASNAIVHIFAVHPVHSTAPFEWFYQTQSTFCEKPLTCFSCSKMLFPYCCPLAVVHKYFHSFYAPGRNSRGHLEQSFVL